MSTGSAARTRQRGAQQKNTSLLGAVWARNVSLLVAALIPMGLLAVVPPGCGSVNAPADAGEDGQSDAPSEPVVTVLTPDAPPLPGQDKCEVTITTHIPLPQATHVEPCTDLDYPTNPPSGGSHWGVWAAFTTYEVPVPREMYVHNMEHGGVILLSKCEGCDGVSELLEEVRAFASGDPKCLQIPGGPTERILITPDPELDVPVAAAAWGATYRATCIDAASLRDFVKEHYDHGPESTCAQGKLWGDPDGGAPMCGTGGSGGGNTGGSGGAGGGGNGGGGAAGAGGG